MKCVFFVAIWQETPIYTNAKFIVICKPRTLNDGGEDSVKYRNRKKNCFLAEAILLLSVKLLYLDSLPESFGTSLS